MYIVAGGEGGSDISGGARVTDTENIGGSIMGYE